MKLSTLNWAESLNVHDKGIAYKFVREVGKDQKFSKKHAYNTSTLLFNKN